MMKKTLIFLLVILTLAGHSTQAQQAPGNLYGMGYFARYYPFEGDVQMVELVYGITDLLAYFRARVSNPPSYASVYLFRDTQGRILRTYNGCASYIDPYTFPLLAPKALKENQLSPHEQTRYPILEDCRFNPNTGIKTARYGAMDRRGNIIIKPQYEELTVSDHCTLLSAKRNGKYGILDENGNQLHAFEYDELESQDYAGGMFLLRKNNRYCFINRNGEQIHTRPYDFADLFWSHRALIRVNGKTGYIDSTGREIVPPIYDGGEPFYYRIAIVRQNGKYGMIDNQGQLVQPFVYDRFENVFPKDNTGFHPCIGYRAYQGDETYFINLDGLIINGPE